MKVKFITLGCKTNQYESNAMGEKFISKGYEITDDVADIYVINTCAVTNVAERKSRQMIRRAKDNNPNAIVVACGCYVQVSKEEAENMPEVDLVLGVNEKQNIVELVEEFIKNKQEIVDVTDVMQGEYQEFGTTTYTELNRAVIKVQDGCDRYCTYCIIPFARGRVRSREPEKVVKEISDIAKTGIKEVVLTGIHIASYGKDFTRDEAVKYREQFGYDNNFNEYDDKEDLASGAFRLIELLEQINKIDGIERIRIGSIEPKIVTDDFINRMAKLDKICDHMHLSLQSGSNKTLQRMNRRYTAEEFKEATDKLRKIYPEIALTTDVIVGFPGETDEEFEETYEFLKDIKFYKLHVFKYSPRKGTAAIKFPNQVDGNIKEERSKRLIELSDKYETEYNESYIGKTVSVLFEEREGEYFKGHTTNYILVKVKTDKDLENQILDVKIGSIDNLEAIGELV